MGKFDPYSGGTAKAARALRAAGLDASVVSLGGGFVGVLYRPEGIPAGGWLIAALADNPREGWGVTYENQTDTDRRGWIEVGPVRFADLVARLTDPELVARALAEFFA